MTTTLEQFETELNELAQKYNIIKIKVSTYDYDDVYEQIPSQLALHRVSRKATIRVLGKVAKVPIGENEQYKTFEEAYQATYEYWREYFKVKSKERRQTVEGKRKAAITAKRIRDRIKAREKEKAKNG